MVVRSPLVEIVNEEQQVETQAHVGVATHADGNGRHWEEKTGIPRVSVCRQYSVPCVQKKAPHENVPAGGVQPPTSEISRPLPFASHSLL